MLTLGRSVPFWSGNPFWLSDVMQPVKLVCVKQWVYFSSQQWLAHGGDKQHFLLIWKEITARNCAGSQTESAPTATINQGCQLVFVLIYLFNFIFSNSERAVYSICVFMLLELFHFLSCLVVLSWPHAHSNWATIPTGHHKNSRSNFGWGIASPLAHLRPYSHIYNPPIPIFMTCTRKSLRQRQLHY